MATLDDKMNDPTHPVTKMLTAIHANKHNGPPLDDDTFKAKIVRAVMKSKTLEHYEALYAMWDDAPFKDVTRMVIKMMFQLAYDA
jgi:hypothetical protein